MSTGHSHKPLTTLSGRTVAGCILLLNRLSGELRWTYIK